MRCADLKGMFRIIQSVTSKKAEPIKVWMASVLTQRVACDVCFVPADYFKDVTCSSERPVSSTISAMSFFFASIRWAMASASFSMPSSKPSL